MGEFELDGEWRAIDSGSSASAFHAIEFDDTDWQRINVPSHWAGNSTLSPAGNSVLYRKVFEHPPVSGQRFWLEFDGVFSHGSVWIDGSYVGDIDNYFARHSFEVTEALSARSDHVIAVEVSAPAFEVPWSAPGGIWRSVRIKPSGEIRIARTRLLCSEARDERGVLRVHLELDSTNSCDVRIRTLITQDQGDHAGSDQEMTRQLAAGANRFSWDVTVEQPRLWWPWSLGDQALFDVVIEVSNIRTPHQVSDAARVRTGFRHVSQEPGLTTVNGERLFIQAIEAGNDGTLPADTSRQYFEDLIGRRRQAGANGIVRSQWIESPQFYEVADEMGMLVWQGAPGGDRRPKLATAKSARQMVETLGHHPSIAVWLRPRSAVLERGPGRDPVKRALDKTDNTRDNIAQPLGWDLRRLDARDVMAIVPKWAKRSRLLHFSSDAHEAAGHIDALRLLKYRPLGGFIAPLALPELLDGACDPVRMIALPQQPLVAHRPAKVDIFVVNDKREALEDVVIYAVSGAKEWSWAGRIAADAAEYIASITVTPTTSGVPVTLRMSGSESHEHSVQLPVKRSGT